MNPVVVVETRAPLTEHPFREPGRDQDIGVEAEYPSIQASSSSTSGMSEDVEPSAAPALLEADDRKDGMRVIDIVMSKEWFRRHPSSSKGKMAAGKAADGKLGKDGPSSKKKKKHARVAKILQDMAQREDGSIDEAELVDAIEKMLAHERSTTHLKGIIVALAVFALFIIAVMTGLTYAIIILVTDVRVGSDGALISKSSGDTIRTASGAMSMTLTQPADQTWLRRRRHLLADSDLLSVQDTATDHRRQSGTSTGTGGGVWPSCRKSSTNQEPAGPEGASDRRGNSGGDRLGARAERRKPLGADVDTASIAGEKTTIDSDSDYIVAAADDHQSAIVMLRAGTVSWAAVETGCRFHAEGHDSFVAHVTFQSDVAGAGPAVVGGRMQWIHVAGCDKVRTRRDPVSAIVVFGSRVFKWLCAPGSINQDGSLSAPVTSSSPSDEAVKDAVGTESCSVFEVFIVAKEVASVQKSTYPPNESEPTEQLIAESRALLFSLAITDPLDPWEAFAGSLPIGSFQRSDAAIHVALPTIPGAPFNNSARVRGAVRRFYTRLLASRGQMGKVLIDGAFTRQRTEDISMDGSVLRMEQATATALGMGLGVLDQWISIPNRFVQRAVPAEFATTYFCTSVACTTAATVEEGGHPLYCSNLHQLAPDVPCKGFVFMQGALNL